MAKFDGLVWKKGDDGWKDIPAGIGYAGAGTFDVKTDIACLRVEDKAEEGYGGLTVDFKTVNDLLNACPAEEVEKDAPPKVLWAGVHPTNLKTALIVWSAPVIILNVELIGGTNPSLDGRCMSVGLQGGVKIDGSDTATIVVQAGAVGAYTKFPDPDEAVVNTEKGMYAATNNDTSIGDDKVSQSTGQDIAIFVPCLEETVTVKVSFSYKVEDALQVCGQPHKIWGASYCIWGSTTPLGVLPFGSVIDVNPGSLAPPAGSYAGIVGAGDFVDRGVAFNITVVGVSGPAIYVKSKNDFRLPLQPGALVEFTNYECDTVCNEPNMTLIADMDEALAYVDEDIIKPQERTFPVHTFLETTYYMTTMYGIITTDVTSYEKTTIGMATIDNMWAGLQTYGTAMQYAPGIKLPKGTDAIITGVKGGAVEFIPVLETHPPETFFVTGGTNQLGVIDPNPYNFLHLPSPNLVYGIVDPQKITVCDFPVLGKAVGPGMGEGPIKQFTVTPYLFRLVPEGAKCVTTVTPTTLTASSFTVPIHGQVSAATGTISSTALTVCGPGGSPSTIYVLTNGGGSVSVVTALNTGAAEDYSFSAYAGGASVVASVATVDASTIYKDIPTAAPDINAVTTLPLVDFQSETVLDGVTLELQTVNGSLVTRGITFQGQIGSLIKTAGPPQFIPELDTPITAWKVTEEIDVLPVNLFAPTTFVQPTVITDPAYGTPVTLLKPSVDILKLAIIDESKVIPILDVTGAPEKAVQLLIGSLQGNLELLGAGGRSKTKTRTITPKASCTAGSAFDGAIDGDWYENQGERKLLVPIPVTKSIGNAASCPCFTVDDTPGGPSAPGDNSGDGDPAPCTLRVRRLQLKKCHEGNPAPS